MNMDDQARQLHDRATRGLPLTAEEQAALNEWYALQDEEERQILAANHEANALPALRSQVETTLGRLRTVSHQIQSLSADNDQARREIAVLQQELAQKRAAQPV